MQALGYAIVINAEWIRSIAVLKKENLRNGL
jgi:hypothetical protein